MRVRAYCTIAIRSGRARPKFDASGRQQTGSTLGEFSIDGTGWLARWPVILFISGGVFLLLRQYWQFRGAARSPRFRPIDPSLLCSLADRRRLSNGGWAVFPKNCTRWGTWNTAITKSSTDTPTAIWAGSQDLRPSWPSFIQRPTAGHTLGRDFPDNRRGSPIRPSRAPR